MITKEQYEKDAAVIDDCHVFLKDVLKDNAEGLEKLSTLYEAAGIGLKQIYLDSKK